MFASIVFDKLNIPCPIVKSSDGSFFIDYKAKISVISCYENDINNEKAKYPPLILIDKTLSNKFRAKPNQGFLVRHGSDCRLKSAYSFEFDGKSIQKGNWYHELWTLLNSQRIVIQDYNHPDRGVGYLFTEKDDESETNTYFVSADKLESSIISAELVHFMGTGSSFATEHSENDSTNVHVPMHFGHHCC